MRDCEHMCGIHLITINFVPDGTFNSYGVGTIIRELFVLQTSNPYGIHCCLHFHIELRRSSIKQLFWTTVMAHKGQVLVNPRNGETVEFLETAKDSGGKQLRFKWTMKPGGLNPVEHLHALQEEEFEVLSGRLSYSFGDTSGVALPGQIITLPKGVRHRHYNNENSDTVVNQTVRPALDAEVIVETLYGFSADGKMKGGRPPIWQMMVWLRTLQAKTYLAAIPKGVQDILSFILSPIGRLLGYRASYVKYSGFES